MVVFAQGGLVGEAQRHAELHLVLRLVRPIPAPALRLPVHRLRQGIQTRQLPDVILDTVLVDELFCLVLSGGCLVFQPEGHAGVDHRLPPHHLPVVVHRDIDIGKHVQVRQPADGGTGTLLIAGLFADLQLAHDLAALKVQAVLLSVAPHGHVHIAGGVLSGAGAQAVQAQRELVVLAVLVVVLAAGVQLAEHQLPVVASLFFVPVHRAAPALVLHLDGPVGEPGHSDELAVAAPGLVNGVGQYLEYRVLAALQPIRAKNDAGPLPYPVRPFQTGDTFIIISRFLCHIYPPVYTDHNSLYII